MKKLLSILLVLAVMGSNTCPALAEEPETDEGQTDTAYYQYTVKGEMPIIPEEWEGLEEDKFSPQKLGEAGYKFLSSVCENMIKINLLGLPGNRKKTEELPRRRTKAHVDSFLFSEPPMGEDVRQNYKKGANALNYAIEDEYLQLSDTDEEFWAYRERKGRFFSVNLVDYLIGIQATDEQIRGAYSEISKGRFPPEYSIEELLELCNKYRNLKGIKKEDILYEEFSGPIYYRMFPYTLIRYIGTDQFDQWKEAAWWENFLFGDSLPNCLNFFQISDEKFAELVQEGGFNYFFTPERMENIAKMRLEPGDDTNTVYPAVGEDEPFPEDIAKDREENPYSKFMAVNSSYIHMDMYYYYGVWQHNAKRKNRYSGLYLVDYLVCIQASEGEIQKVYDFLSRFYMNNPLEYSLEELLELCRRYQDFDKVPKEDILYEEAYGNLYYRTFPRTLTDYIGEEAFDKWKRHALEQDPDYGDTLPKCLDYFDIPNEKFAELVKEGGFGYFFTPERLEGIAQMRRDGTNQPVDNTDGKDTGLTFPEDVSSERKENPYAAYLFVHPAYFMSSRERDYEKWKCEAERKNRYSGLNIVDYLVCAKASKETIKGVYYRISQKGLAKFPLDELQEICKKYREMENIPAKDILYEELYGNLYYRTFPQTLIDYIGVEEFDEWRKSAWRGDVNYGDTLPKCLDYFDISNKDFAFLVEDGGFDYFFTPERLASIAQMRENAD